MCNTIQDLSTCYLILVKILGTKFSLLGMDSPAADGSLNSPRNENRLFLHFCQCKWQHVAVLNEYGLWVRKDDWPRWWPLHSAGGETSASSNQVRERIMVNALPTAQAHMPGPAAAGRPQPLWPSCWPSLQRVTDGITAGMSLYKYHF